MYKQHATYQTIGIETPENIAFEYELAGPGTRMTAFLIDYLLISIILSSIIFIFIQFVEVFTSGRTEDILIAILIAIVSILYPLGGYFIFFELIMRGQSPGKRVMGIRVVMENGAPISIGPVFLRNIFRVVDCFFPIQYGVGTLLLVFNAKGKRFGDMAGGTIVVKESKAEQAAKYRWKKVRQGRKEQVVPLTPAEFDMITSYADKYRNLALPVRNRLAQKVVNPVIRTHLLETNLHYTGMVRKYLSAPEQERYKYAEFILRDLMQGYVAEEKR